LASDALAAAVGQAVAVGVVVGDGAGVALRGTDRADARSEGTAPVLGARLAGLLPRAARAIAVAAGVSTADSALADCARAGRVDDVVGETVAVIVEGRSAVATARKDCTLARCESAIDARTGAAHADASIRVGAASDAGAFDAATPAVWRPVAVGVVTGHRARVFGLWRDRAHAFAPIARRVSGPSTQVCVPARHEPRPSKPVCSSHGRAPIARQRHTSSITLSGWPSQSLSSAEVQSRALPNTAPMHSLHVPSTQVRVPKRQAPSSAGGPHRSVAPALHAAPASAELEFVPERLS
jgi:hypothetical protein